MPLSVYCITLISFLLATLVYPLVLSFALRYNIVDNPGYRKLQRKPVPVLGGIVVLFGFLLSVFVGVLFWGLDVSWYFIIACLIMTAVGCWDDVVDISASLRLVIEICVFLGFVFFDDCVIDSFHGFLGVYSIPRIPAILLTVVAGVGITNAINLIDGIDGYSSGYCMVASVIFSLFFLRFSEVSLGIIALVLSAAVLPFFLHNVFGYWSKMYIGDSGTLLMGTILSFFVLKTLNSKSPFAALDCENFSTVGFCLAILAVPVFDTLRVMSRRIMRKRSPFSPDKTHLHHAFIELGFSHIGTSISIIFLNISVVLSFFVAYGFRLSITKQVLVVVFMGLIITLAMYSFMKTQKYYNTRASKALEHIGAMTHKDRTGFWLFMRKLVDGKHYKEGPDDYYDNHPLNTLGN